MNRLVDLGQHADSRLSYSIAKLEQDSWHRVLDDFEDASVFQTAPFCSARGESQACEHLVLTNGSGVVAGAQVRVISVPFFAGSIAYVLSGPLFHRRASDPDWGALRQALRALRTEYVVRRKGSLRVRPLFTHDREHECLSLFRAEGYTYVLPRKARRTIIIDLERSLGELRKGLDQKWRNCLNRAEKNGLDIVEGSDDAMFGLFLEMYREMLKRKRLAEPGDIRTFRAMQEVLPERYKMKVIVVLDKGEPSAGAIISAIGRRGIYLFGATADSGMRNKASYLAQWRAIQWLKEMHCAEYDLHGVNAESNRGVYAFKTGLCGANGREVEFIGQFDAHNSFQSRVVLAVADFVNRRYKRLKELYGRYRGFQG